MPINSSELKAKIYGKYGTQARFSAALQWDCNKISRILRGERVPDIDECADMARALSLTVQEYYNIFLPSISPYGEKSNKVG